MEESLNKRQVVSGKMDAFSVLELRIRVFSDYGRNLVSDKLLRDLYKIKSNMLFRDLVHSYNGKNFEDFNFVELEQYKEIIYSKINEILMSNNKLLTKLFGEEYGY